MLTATVISVITCLFMVLAVLVLPQIKVGKVCISSYWLVTLAGAAVLLFVGCIDIASLGVALVADTAINPVKILVLFISMTILSIFLDELGFFRYLANIALSRAGTSQKRLFMLLYVTVSILTVFTSNDIIILSFTPFICYFAKNAKISPMPFLAAEFVAANTWSMALIIGNPTNVYLATATGSDFVSYMKVMLPVTLVSGIVAFAFLYMLFREKLSDPIQANPEAVAIEDKVSLGLGIAHLAVCTIMLAIGSYIGVEMWLVSFVSVISLFIFSIVISLFRAKKLTALSSCLKRAPWELIPFVISMFVMVEALTATGVTNEIFHLLSGDLPIWKYGASSFLVANVINNIPMSVLYSSILANTTSQGAVFATVIGSNLGACLTPIGALAGIMWSSILKEHSLKFGYTDFLKIGVVVGIPALAGALGILQLVL